MEITFEPQNWRKNEGFVNFAWKSMHSVEILLDNHQFKELSIELFLLPITS